MKVLVIYRCLKISAYFFSSYTKIKLYFQGFFNQGLNLGFSSISLFIWISWACLFLKLKPNAFILKQKWVFFYVGNIPEIKRKKYSRAATDRKKKIRSQNIITGLQPYSDCYESTLSFQLSCFSSFSSFIEIRDLPVTYHLKLETYFMW